MSIEQAIYSQLSNHAPLSALVSQRIYPDYDKTPEDTSESLLPFVVFTLNSEDEETDITGNFLWFKSTYVFACVADDPDTKAAIATALKVALRAMQGQYAGAFVEAAYLRNSADEPSEELHDVGLHVRTVEYEIWHA